VSSPFHPLNYRWIAGYCATASAAADFADAADDNYGADPT
jgi:hypothetical protein